MHVSRRLRHFCLPAILLIAGRSGMAAAQSAPSPSAASTQFSATEKPFATISRMFLKSADRDSLVELARSQVGVAYRFGAKAPGKAFDCSGLVQWLMSKFDFALPRTSKQQATAGVAIPKDSSLLLPGDLLYFGHGAEVTHIGIYIGNGRFIQAASPRLGVIESALPTGRAAVTWWKGVRRVFDPDSSGMTGPSAGDSVTHGKSSS